MNHSPLAYIHASSWLHAFFLQTARSWEIAFPYNKGGCLCHCCAGASLHHTPPPARADQVLAEASWSLSSSDRSWIRVNASSLELNWHHHKHHETTRLWGHFRVVQ